LLLSKIIKLDIDDFFKNQKTKELNSDIKTYIRILIKDLPNGKPSIVQYLIIWSLLKHKDLSKQPDLLIVRDILCTLVKINIQFIKLGGGARVTVPLRDAVIITTINIRNNKEYNYNDFINDIYVDTVKRFMISDVIVDNLIKTEYDRNDSLTRLYLLLANYQKDNGIRNSILSNTSIDDLSAEHIIGLKDKSINQIKDNINDITINELTSIRRLRSTLANACLLKLSPNKQINDSYFEDKKETYRNSGISLTSELSNFNKFTLSEMKINYKNNLYNILMFLSIDEKQNKDFLKKLDELFIDYFKYF